MTPATKITYKLPPNNPVEGVERRTHGGLKYFCDRERKRGPFTVRLRGWKPLIMFLKTFPTIRKACEWAETHERPVEWCDIMNRDGTVVSEHQRGIDETHWCQLTWSRRGNKIVYRRRYVKTSKPYTKSWAFRK